MLGLGRDCGGGGGGLVNVLFFGEKGSRIIEKEEEKTHSVKVIIYLPVNE